VHATGHLLPRLGWREVWSARALVIVPRFVTELEIRDVLLGQDLVEQCLTRNGFRRQSMVGALLVQLHQRRSLIAGPIRRLGQDQSVLIVADEGLRVVRS